jgi:hypothetical protein
MTICHACGLPIADAVVWLADEAGNRYPMHRACADQPWPLYEVPAPLTPEEETALKAKLDAAGFELLPRRRRTRD